MKWSKSFPLTPFFHQLFYKCLAPDTMGDGTGCDNMTCIVVHLNATENGKRKQADNEADVSSEVSGERDSKRVRTQNDSGNEAAV